MPLTPWLITSTADIVTPDAAVSILRARPAESPGCILVYGDRAQHFATLERALCAPLTEWGPGAEIRDAGGTVRARLETVFDGKTYRPAWKVRA